jgi:hypothetical protein
VSNLVYVSAVPAECSHRFEEAALLSRGLTDLYLIKGDDC